MRLYMYVTTLSNLGVCLAAFLFLITILVSTEHGVVVVVAALLEPLLDQNGVVDRVANSVHDFPHVVKSG